MTRAYGRIGFLGLAALVGGGTAGWSQQPAPPVHATAADTLDAQPDSNSLTLDVVGKVFAEDQNNLKDYWPNVEKKTKDSWVGMMPAQAAPPQSTPGTVRIACVLHTDGSVTDMALEQKSGKASLDRAAWTALRQSAPYEPFPSGISANQVKVRFTFLYNGGASAGVKAGQTPN